MPLTMCIILVGTVLNLLLLAVMWTPGGPFAIPAGPCGDSLRWWMMVVVLGAFALPPVPVMQFSLTITGSAKRSILRFGMRILFGDGSAPLRICKMSEPDSELGR